MQIQRETLVQLRQKINQPFSQSNIFSLTNIVKDDAVIAYRPLMRSSII